MALQKYSAAAMFALLTLGVAPQSQAIIMTDIVMMVDESGSMGNIQRNLRDNIGLFASTLSAGGNIDARYGLVGYGNSNVKPRMLTDLTTPAGFATAAANLVAAGGSEPGYTATAFALNGLDNQTSLFSYRVGAVKNLILFTDEPHNGIHPAWGAIGGVSPTLTMVDTMLKDNNALFNAVLSGQTTINSYRDLALGNHGQVFNLSLLNTSNEAQVKGFVTEFANAKLQETVDFCTANPSNAGCQAASVPVPQTWALLGLGLLGLGMVRTRRH